MQQAVNVKIETCKKASSLPMWGPATTQHFDTMFTMSKRLRTRRRNSEWKELIEELSFVSAADVTREDCPE